MSKFNQLAKSDKPLLFLSADSTLDQSGNSYALSNNNLQTIGQPIVYENLQSFLVDSTHGVDIPNNPVFFSNKGSVEFVALFYQPTTEIPILIDDNDNGIYIDSNGIIFKIFSDSTVRIDISIDDWTVQHYVRVDFSEFLVNLTVDQDNESVVHTYTQQNDSLHLLPSSGNKFLLDSFGFYKKMNIGRENFIKDPGTGHEFYAAKIFGGRETRLDSYDSTTLVVNKSGFLYDPEYSSLYYVYELPQETVDAVIHIKTDYPFEIRYALDHFNLSTFTEELLIDVSSKKNIVIAVDDSSIDFLITIKFISNQTIENQTPATLEFSGPVNFADPLDTSIVNLGRGAVLDGISALGQSLITMQTIEMLIKPKSSVGTVIFENSDCSVSYGSSGGVTTAEIYLNGSLVSDLSSIKFDEWNHVVIIPDAHTDSTFTLNSTLEYFEIISLTLYPSELTASNVSDLYDIVSGKNELSIEESPVSVSEVSFGGQNINIYSYNWAIVSSG